MDTSSEKVKRQNPFENANFLSVITFMYLLPVFKHGSRKGFIADDLYRPLPEHKSSDLGDRLQTILKKEPAKNKSTSLTRALFKMFGPELILLGLVKLTSGVVSMQVPPPSEFKYRIFLCSVALPISVAHLIAFFRRDQTEISTSRAYLCVCLIVLCRLTDVVVYQASMMELQHCFMKMRVTCGSSIYRKVLRVHTAALNETTTGQVINLLSNDIHKLDDCYVLNYIWTAPVITAVGTYLLYEEIGISAFLGISILLVFLLCQLYSGKVCFALRLKIAAATDRRLRLMDELITNIKTIKMYCWEKPFGKFVLDARSKEIRGLFTRGIIIGTLAFFHASITKLAIFASITCYAMLGQNVTAGTVFVVTTIYTILRTDIALFTIALNYAVEVGASLRRIEKFLSLKEKTAAPSADNTKPEISVTSDGATFEIRSNQLIGLTGPTGGGKTTLLKRLLGELPVGRGSLTVNGTIAYCPQEAWLFNASLRQNVTFGSEYDPKRYREVLDLCCLRDDVEMLPRGDATVVGENGKLLSGGQRARVNLARCVYKRADIYLLDDPLAAVDANVGGEIYDRCLRGFLGDKIRVLVTQQRRHLSGCDKILLVTNGRIETVVDYEELEKGGDILSDKLDKEEIKEAEDEEKVGEEQTALLVKKQVQGGVLNWSLYRSYVEMGGMCRTVCMIVLLVGSQAMTLVPDYYLTTWVNAEQDFQEKSFRNLTNDKDFRNDYLHTYPGIMAAMTLVGIANAFFFSHFFVSVSTALHRKCLDRIVEAVMSFFRDNPSGRVLNRFSKDLSTVDETIPSNFQEAFGIMTRWFVSLVLYVVVDFRLCFPSLGMLLALAFLARFYLRTSKNVKRLEATLRSSLYSHASASMSGVSTIRAFSMQRELTKEFDRYQDRQSGAWFLYIACSRCFGLWIDLICVVFVTAAMLILLCFGHEIHGGDLGFVITQVMSFTVSLQRGIVQWSLLENNMVSLERCLEYCEVEADPKRGKHRSSAWPDRGVISFKDVSLRYDGAYALRGISLSFNPKEKIGIVGRTGAGKSSLIASLFQLYPTEGGIEVDGVDVTKVDLGQVRSAISIIPQEPFVYSGTLRQNLDPAGEHDDEALWRALRRVEMKPAGLEVEASEFSAGQRQLICLARTLLKDNKILVLDEATANVDRETDALIRDAVREYFAECTVLTVAHRLETVIDSDRILVMKDGKVAEFDRPLVLFDNESGAFRGLVRKAGADVAADLKKMTRKEHLAKKDN